MCPNLRRSAAALLAALAVSATASAANWQLVASYRGERVEIDKARVARVGKGQTIAWNRLLLGRELTMPGSRESYSAVQALNRYDCDKGSFVTIKRVFLRQDKVVREEVVASPKEMAAAPGSIDEKLLVEACKKRTVGEMKQIAEEAGKLAAEAVARPSKTVEPQARAMHADMRSAGVEKAPTVPAADPAVRDQPEEKPAAAPRKIRRKPPARRIATAAAAAQAEAIPWGYEGAGGPAHWGTLRPDYATCATGKRQSPIDIKDGIRVDLEPIKFDYKPTMFRIVNNGHTVEIEVGAGSSIRVMGRQYQLQQIHFHRPSEERVNGRAYDMVMHLVHKDDQGHIAVVAVLLQTGAENPVIQTFWNNLPLEVDQNLAPDVAIDANRLLPENRDYYAYMGSLTTPPCTEDVLWLVLKRPMQVSADQVAIFARLYPDNARPLQPANNRLIKESR